MIFENNETKIEMIVIILDSIFKVSFATFFFNNTQYFFICLNVLFMILMTGSFECKKEKYKDIFF